MTRPRASRLRRLTRPFRHALAYGLLRAVTGLLGCLPLALAQRAGAGLGRVVGLLARRPRRIARAQLATLGAGDRIGEHFADLGRRFIELTAGPAAVSRVDLPPDLVEALRGQPVLALTAHYGHWELLGAALAAAGVEVHSVAARGGSGPLHRWLAGRRMAAGLTVHPPGGGARTALARLRAGQPVAIFFDLSTRERARTLVFLGRPTRFSRTAERLLATSGARAVRLWSVRGTDGRYRVSWAPLTGDDPLAEAAAALEVEVRADPVQWVWLAERWGPDRDTVRGP